jgi:hypothetical protein
MALNPDALPARERSAAELHEQVKISLNLGRLPVRSRCRMVEPPDVVGG